MDNTWVKLYRKLLEHPIIKDASATHVFMWVLLSVDEHGKMTTGRIKAAEQLGLDPSTFRYILHEKLCKKWGMVNLALDDTKRFTHITVTNWQKYQAHFAEKSLNQETYQQGFNTKGEKLSTISLTQGNSLENDDGLTQEDQSLTPSLTQPLTQQSDTNNSLKNEDSLTQVSEKSLTQQSDTVLRINKEYKNTNNTLGVEPPKSQEISRKPKTNGSHDDVLFDILNHWNRERGKKCKSINAIRTNALKHLEEWTAEEIKLSISNYKYDEWWGSRDMEIETFFRFKDKHGEPVNYVSRFFNIKRPGGKRNDLMQQILEDEQRVKQRKEVYGQAASTL